MAEHHPRPKEAELRLQKVLAPLSAMGTSAERELLKETNAIEAASRRYQAVNQLYATAFEKVQGLEETVALLRERWQREPC